MPALMLSTTILNASALPSATLVDISQVREYENAATEHWIFDKGSAASLVGLKGASTLTKIGGVAESYNPKSVVLPGTLGNQLSTTIADQLTYTWCAVVRVPAQDNSAIGHSIFSTNSANSGAFLGIQGGASYDLWSRANYVGGTNQAYQNITDLTVGSWQFYAFAIDHSGTNRLTRISLGTLSLDYAGGTQFVPSTTIKLSLGPTSIDNTTTGLEFAEAILFAGVALTPTLITAVYQRSKARMLRRAGIAIN